MVNLIFKGVLDPVFQNKHVKVGKTEDIMSLPAEEFLKGSLYDLELDKHVGLLEFTRNLTSLLVKEANSQQDIEEVTLTIDAEFFGCLDFYIYVKTDYVLPLQLSDLGVCGAYVATAVTENNEKSAYIGATISGTETSIYINLLDGVLFEI